MANKIIIHVLHCGYIRVSEKVPFGNRIGLGTVGRELLAPEKERVTLPVCAYLIEHPKGLILVDTGWSREISPEGVYDPRAVEKVLPKPLAGLFHPWVPKGAAIHEQLEERGLRAEDLDLVLLTHLDPDHVSGLKHVNRAKRIILPEDEYFWACRTVYRLRQPWSLWIDQPIERLYYRASAIGPNRWGISFFEDESVRMINVPGHTEGQAAVMVSNGPEYLESTKFALLAADAAYSPRNWRESITPGFGFNREGQLKSLRWIAETERKPGCVRVLCSHDPEVGPQTVEF